MHHANDAIVKGAVGLTGAVTAQTNPSNYVSYFDRVYDIFGFVISGDDAARLVGMLVGMLVAANIFYNVVKDYRERQAERRRQEAERQEKINTAVNPWEEFKNRVKIVSEETDSGHSKRDE